LRKPRDARLPPLRLDSSMLEPIHGHEIIDMVSKNPDGLTVAQLTESVAKQFGGMPRFYTCSAENLTLDELLEFLHAGHKIRISGESIYPGKSPACHH